MKGHLWQLPRSIRIPSIHPSMESWNVDTQKGVIKFQVTLSLVHEHLRKDEVVDIFNQDIHVVSCVQYLCHALNIFHTILGN